MRSLLAKIFASFWTIILLTILLAVTIGYTYAERTRLSMQRFEGNDLTQEAASVLATSNRDGLIEWLKQSKSQHPFQIYIIDDQGQELLDRRLPRVFKLALKRHRAHRARPRDDQRPNYRPARPFTQLIGPDERRYTVFVRRTPKGSAGWLAERGVAVLVLLAILTSATVSYWLARTISRPIEQLRASANAIAAGDFKERVTARMGSRRDELGLLATDFDRMASELQQAWRRQTELTRNVSHELRSPLARLRVALELVRRKTGDLAELERIEVETARLDTLIGRILEYSRLNADQTDKPVNINLYELLESVVSDIRFEYREGENRIELVGDSDAPMRGFPAALRSCLENVVRNAMAHTDGPVRIGLTREADECVIRVDDHGRGVPDAELGQIFEPFYRPTTSANRPRQAAGGLGLAIAARAVAMHAGSISASNIDTGLRVEIRVPVSAPAAVGEA